MKKRILVFGKNGQLGRSFQQQLGSGSNIFYLGRQECDLTSTESIRKHVEQLMPDRIINAAAYTAVDKAEGDSQTAFTINEAAVGEMAHYCHAHNKILIHFSTDYVFDGEKDSPYAEYDVCRPVNIYGKSKLAGEEIIKETFSKNDISQSNLGGTFFIFRTTWVYGDGVNFIRTLLRLAKERSELKVVVDQFGVPTATDWLSQLVMTMLDGGHSPSGIYHAVPAGKTSWYELAHFVLESAKEMGLVYKLKTDRLLPIPAQEYSLPAKRPANSILSSAKLQQYLPSAKSLLEEDWRAGVRAYLHQLNLKGLT